MLAALLTVLVLSLFDGRGRLAVAPWKQRSEPPLGRWLLAAIVVTLGGYPLLKAAPLLLRADAVLLSDAATHATVAAEIAQRGLPHGWISTYDGGFPVSLHYPVVGWAAVALLVQAGVNVVVAQQTLAWLSAIATPVLALFTARSAGAHVLPATMGALCLALLSPFQLFTGGWEPYFGAGLLSQALAAPLVIGLGWAIVARRGSTFSPPLVATLLVACHPQIAIGALVVLTLPVVVSRDRCVVLRFVRAGVAAAVTAIALFAPGIASLKVPFGWPPMESWKLVGFAPDRLWVWLTEGSLLDDSRAPVLSLALFASITIAAGLARRRSSQVALTAFGWALCLVMGGPLLTKLGAVGSALLSFLQPLRVLPMLPLTAALCVVVGAEELRALLMRPCLRRAGRGWPIELVLALCVALGVKLALPVREAWMQERLTFERRAPGTCSDELVDAREVMSWVRGLRGPGRIDASLSLLPCMEQHGSLRAGVLPHALSYGVGAHVGVNAIAFANLRASEPGGALRAESLGVRYVVHGTKEELSEREGWVTRQRAEGVVLSERLGGADLVGVGCVRSALRGSDRALRERLFALLAEPGSFLDEPRSLMRLEETRDGVATLVEVPEDGCSTEGASVSERAREPGAYEATLVAAAPVDVVIRATAFETWRVWVDGHEVPWQRVAPGFVVARVSAGQHHIEAVVSLPRGYLFGLSLAVIIVVLCGCRSAHFAFVLAGVSRWRSAK